MSGSEPEEKSNLDKLEEGVYSRTEHTPYDRAHLDTPKDETPLSWRGRRVPPGQHDIGIVPPSGYSPFLLKFLIASALFFVVAAGISFYKFFNGGGTVSPDKISIIMKGPPSAKGGEAFPLSIEVVNSNPVGLETATLILDYPEGVRITDSSEQNRYSKELGSIATNGRKSETLELKVFGKENTEQIIKAHVEYRTADSLQVSRTRDIKQNEYSVTVSSAPVSITTKIPPELNTGEEFTFEIRLTGNTGTPINDLLVSLVYPDSFVYVSGVPLPAHGKTIWRIKELKEGEEEVIKIRGTMTGEVDSEKTLEVKVGLEDPDRPREIGILYTSTRETFTVKRSFVGLSLDVSGEDKPNFTVVKSGNTVSTDLSWINNLDTKIQNVRFEARVNGLIVDRASITPSLGEYRSAEDVILWNQQTDRTYASLDPNQKGTIHFTFATKSLFESDGYLYRKPEFLIEITFLGNRISEGFNNELITLKTSRKIRVSSAVTLGTEATYYEGTFSNTGPLPPQAEKETTYTLSWNLSNSSNDVRDAVVSAKLPPYMRWLGKTNPASGITYNEATGEVRWLAGDLPAGTGFGPSPKTASFQVSFTPSISQIGATPALINEAQFTGIDTFTDTKLSGTKSPILTSQVKDLRPENIGEVKP
jgi:hypothetical protein